MNNLTLIKRILFFLSGISLLSFVIFYSLEETGYKEYIWIEAENTKKIVWPLKVIEDDNASGGKCIISENRSHHPESVASYDFDISTEGIYYFWARAFWPGGCSNSFSVQIDNSDAVLFGNDNQMFSWHWVKGPQYNLKKGKYTLHIWDEEQYAQLDKMLLTADLYFVPVGYGGVRYDILVNFENGIPDIIQPITSHSWVVDSIDRNRCYYLMPNKKAVPEYSIINIPNIKRGAFSCFMKTNKNELNPNALILFNFIDPNNYHCIDINNSSVVFSTVSNGKSTTISKFESNTIFVDTIFHEYTLTIDTACITLKIGGKTIAEIMNKDLNMGNIGFGSRKGNIYFDNLEYVSDLTPRYHEDFFWVFTNDLKMGRNSLPWQFHSGNWVSERTSTIMSLEGNADFKHDALITTGKEYWKNYSYTAAVKTNGEAGICFYVQDKNNYYMNKIVADSMGDGKLQLLKIKNNEPKILKEDNIAIKRGEWYKLSVNIYNNRITSSLNDKKVIECNDDSFKDGGIGCWCNSLVKRSAFDDIDVKPSLEVVNDDLPNKFDHEYLFEMREKAGIDFCDWENSANIFENIDDFALIKKDLFKESYMINRYIFSGSFNIAVENSKVSNDIYCNIMMLVNKNDTEYRIELKNNKVILLKNNEIIKERAIKLKRLNYNLTYTKDSLIVCEDGKTIIEYPMILGNSDVKLGISYSGIGKGNLYLKKVRIMAQSFKTNSINN